MTNVPDIESLIESDDLLSSTGRPIADVLGPTATTSLIDTLQRADDTKAFLSEIPLDTIPTEADGHEGLLEARDALVQNTGASDYMISHLGVVPAKYGLWQARLQSPVVEPTPHHPVFLLFTELLSEPESSPVYTLGAAAANMAFVDTLEKFSRISFTLSGADLTIRHKERLMIVR